MIYSFWTRLRRTKVLSAASRAQEFRVYPAQSLDIEVFLRENTHRFRVFNSGREPVEVKTVDFAHLSAISLIVEDLRREKRGREAGAKAASFLDNVAILLPGRIVNEDLGDFLEDINRRASRGQDPVKIYLRTAAATFWLMVNTVSYLLRAMAARKSA